MSQSFSSELLASASAAINFFVIDIFTFFSFYLFFSLFLFLSIF